MSDIGSTLATNDKELLHQIRNYFSDWKVTEYDLKTPSSSFVIEFYKNFLSEFFIKTNLVTQIHISQMMILGDCDMFNEILPLINLTAAVKKFCIPALKTFCVYDLINPQPKRTFTHLANVMLFIMFSDSKIANLEPKFELMKTMEAEKEQILKNIDEMKQAYNMRLMEVAEKRNEIEQKEAEIKRLNKEYEELDSIKEELKEKLTIIKLQVNESRTHQEEFRKEYQMLMNDINEFSHQIKLLEGNDSIQDPSSETLSLEVLEEKAKDSGERLKRMRESLTCRQENCDELNKMHSDLIARIDVLKEITSDVNAKNEYDQKKEELNKFVTTCNENIEKMKTDICSIGEELTKNNEKLVGFRMQWAKKESSLKESVDFAKKEFENQQKINLSKQQELSKYMEEVDNYNQKLAENKNVYNSLLDNFENEEANTHREEGNKAYEMMELLRELSKKFD